jgi:hypothetical protein
MRPAQHVLMHMMSSCVKHEDSDIASQGEEIPIAISFPTIKCEQDEVSYNFVCSLLGALCQYPEILTAIRHLHISVDLSVHLMSSTVVNRNFFLYLDCVKHL